jgi:glycosyl transferase family 25
LVESKEFLQSNEPALILEDDALLSKYTPKLLADLADKKKCELISLENRNRKKFVALAMLHYSHYRLILQN